MSYATEVRILKKTLEDLPNVPRSIIRDAHIAFLNVECLHLMGVLIAESRTIIATVIEAQNSIDQGTYDKEQAIDHLAIQTTSQAASHPVEKTLVVYKATSEMINTDEFLEFFLAYENSHIERAIEDFALDGHPSAAKYSAARLDMF